MTQFKTIISKFKNKNILVIGDLILDQHIYGQVSRISPEAPVPVVQQDGHSVYAPGGAANVANNLASLGVKATLVGQIGDDLEGAVFLKEIAKRKVSTKGIITSQKVPTIVKTRILAQHQQVLRLDREKLNGGPEKRVQSRIIAYIEKNIQKFDAVIISDYGKGVVTKELLSKVCTLAKEHKLIITVDPKDDNFALYKEVTAITPNKKEAENAIRNIKITHNGGRRLAIDTDRLTTHEQVVKAGQQLVKYLKLESLLITLGEDGMCLFEKGKKSVHIHTQAQGVFDVTGAGDTVIALFTLSLVSGSTKKQAAELANLAAGIVVGQMGPATVTKEELIVVTKGK